ncbi:hypothetical protein GKODMF_05880 [Candidatus Electrothrix gigas]
MTTLTADLQLLFIMSVLGAIAHDLFPGVAVNAGHALCMMHILGNLQIKTVARQTLRGMLTVFVRGAIALSFKFSCIGNPDPSRAIMAANTVLIWNLFCDERMRFFCWPCTLLFKGVHRGGRISLCWHVMTGRTAAAFFIEKFWIAG